MGKGKGNVQVLGARQELLDTITMVDWKRYPEPRVLDNDSTPVSADAGGPNNVPVAPRGVDERFASTMDPVVANSPRRFREKVTSGNEIYEDCAQQLCRESIDWGQSVLKRSQLGYGIDILVDNLTTPLYFPVNQLADVLGRAHQAGCVEGGVVGKQRRIVGRTGRT